MNSKQRVSLFKSGFRDDLNKYSPVSIHLVAFNLLERTVHDQLYEGLNVNDAFSVWLSGFRSNFP